MKWANFLENTTCQNWYKKKKKVSSPPSIKSLSSLLKNFPMKRNPGPDSLAGVFYQISKKETFQFYTNSFRKLRSITKAY